MHAVSEMTERESIAYRRGFHDGLVAMRNEIKNLLIENARLHKPFLGPAQYAAAARNREADRISGEDLGAWLAQPGPPARFVHAVGGHFEREAVGSGNGRGQP